MDRQMTTGNHTVRDIYCCKCGANLGWKYVSLRSARNDRRPYHPDTPPHHRTTRTSPLRSIRRASTSSNATCSATCSNTLRSCRGPLHSRTATQRHRSSPSTVVSSSERSQRSSSELPRLRFTTSITVIELEVGSTSTRTPLLNSARGPRADDACRSSSATC